MMISPEYFYEENLKGKSAEEILTVIRGLKREIGRLKNIIEHPKYQCEMHPSEDTRIWCNRLYLERAKQALAEVGGTYTPSQAELRAEKFNANLPHLCRVEFEINGYSTGYEEKTYIIEDDKVITTTNRVSYTTSPEPPTSDDEEIDKNTLLDGLANLHIGEWRREYDTRDIDIRICDGTQWDLKFYFSNGAKPVKIYGSNSYPYNFAKLLELFDIQFFI